MASINVTKFGQVIKVVNLATASAPSSPENGMIYYDTDDTEFKFRENGAWVNISSAAGSSFSDANFEIYDDGDSSKKIVFQASGITTSTTRTIIMPDSNVNLGQIATNASNISNNTSNISGNTSDIADLRTTQGTSDGDTDLGTFTGSTISDNGSVKAGMQELETAVEARIPSSEKGAANGVATLDGSGLLPASQLPVSAMEHKGAWDADTNSPTLADGSGTNGDFYRVSVAGSQDLGSGSISFVVGDAVIYNGSIWQKIPGNDLVLSVNGATGAVSLDSDDISEGATNFYYTEARFNTSFSGKSTTDLSEGTNLYYTQARFDSAFTAKDTDDLSEGAANFYYTEARFDTSLATKDTDDLAEGTNLYFTDARAKAAAVADAINDGTTDVAPSQNAVFDALALKLANVVEDTTPQLGGALDANSNAIYDANGLKLGSSSSAYVIDKYASATLTASTTAVASSLTFAHASFPSCVIDYQIVEATSGEVRSGQLYVATDGTDVSVSDTFTESADCGVTWSGAINGTDVELSYTTSANNKTMKSMQRLFAA